MADDKKKVGRQDRERINMHEDYELRDWSKKLGVSKEEPKEAVQKVGSSAEAVRKHGHSAANRARRLLSIFELVQFGIFRFGLL